MGLGTRLRRLIAALDAGVQAAYDGSGIRFKPRYYPIVRILLTKEEESVGALAAALGVTQPAVTQTVSEMGKAGLVAIASGADRRERLVHLTSAGRALVGELAPIWRATDAAARRLDEEVGGGFGEMLDRMLDRLAAEPFDARIAGELAS